MSWSVGVVGLPVWVIQCRRSAFFCHVARLADNTPAKNALCIASNSRGGLAPAPGWKISRGRPRSSWGKQLPGLVKSTTKLYRTWTQEIGATDLCCLCSWLIESEWRELASWSDELVRNRFRRYNSTTGKVYPRELDGAILFHQELVPSGPCHCVRRSSALALENHHWYGTLSLDHLNREICLTQDW